MSIFLCVCLHSHTTFVKSPQIGPILYTCIGSGFFVIAVGCRQFTENVAGICGQQYISTHLQKMGLSVSLFVSISVSLSLCFVCVYIWFAYVFVACLHILWYIQISSRYTNNKSYIYYLYMLIHEKQSAVRHRLEDIICTYLQVFIYYRYVG